MSEWKTYKFGEFAELRKEQVKPNGEEQPYIGLEHIEQQRLRLNGIGSSENVISNKFKFYSGDVLYGKLRPYFRKVYSPKFDGVCSTDIFVIQNNHKIDKRFLFYLVANEDFTAIATSGSTGTRMPRADWNQLKKSEWNLPDLPTQQQIAQILTSLDDKIELNLQMNQTLEEMAQAIFKEWCCVDDGIVPDGWSIMKLSELANISSSKRIFREEYQVEGIPFYRGKEITQLSNGQNISTELFISNERYFEIREKFGVPQINDILITSVGTIGSIWLVDNDLPFYFKDGNVTWVKEYKTNINGEFIYQWLKTNEAKEQIMSVTIGSTQQALTISALRNLEILIPDSETVNKICSQLEAINAKRITNTNQLQSLTQTRDTLLPKLMNGQLELKN